MPTAKKGDIVLVTWNDAGHFHPGEWVQHNEIPKWSMRCTTVGRVVKRKRKYLLVAQTRSEVPGDFTGLFVIPFGMIKKIRRLK